MTDSYCYLRIQGEGRNWQPLKQALAETVVPSWAETGVSPWGIWHGLFGIGSNELIVMAASNADGPPDRFTAPLTGVADVCDVELLTNTVRPVDIGPCERPGLYVFRFFEVLHKDVEEIARLSNDAWQTFENVEDYEAVPQGLFCQHDRNEAAGRMLLVTWYDGLQSWQTSRQPAQSARDNFVRRGELTRSTIALATRLVS